MKILITLPQGEIYDSFISEETVKLLKKFFEVDVNEKNVNFTPEELYDRGKDADVLMTGWGTPSLKSADFYEKDNKLKMLAHTGGSVADYVDNTAYEKGIRVVSGNKMYAQSTAEGALAYILMGLRHLPDDVYSMRKGDYWQSPYLTRGLRERSVGIIGVGAVAKNLMSYLKPLGARIKVYDTYEVDKAFLKTHNAEQVPLAELLSTCSVISLHMALNQSTRGLIGKNELELLNDGALFVNTSRGPIVDEAALINELKKGRISAVLDVYTKEPLSSESELRKLKNVYLIPHKAGPTYDFRSVIGYRIAEDIVRFFNGEELLYEILPAEASRMTKHS